VGASLLAMAVGLAMKVLPVRPPSLAGKLPHLIALRQLEPGQPVGASLLAMAVGLAMEVPPVGTPSLAGKLPH